MPSTLAWLHHDSAARDRTKRILALFSEQGTVDQLGLGAIRDSLADLLFPGTSTIQTRLRYFLFVPWIYLGLEEEQVDARRVAAIAREREVALIAPLLAEQERGIFGGQAGGTLRRLPSEVYWGGLGSWGIRRFNVSRDQYQRAFDEIHERRRSARRASSGSAEADAALDTWHPELPPPPPDFPASATMALSRPEAEFIRDRIVAEYPTSLLAWLTLNPSRTDVSFIWQHPMLEHVSAEHHHLLHHARLFSQVMNGAAILYNFMLSEQAQLEELLATYSTWLDEWAAALNSEEVAEWSLTELFAIARRVGAYQISPRVEEFVRHWVALARSDAAGLPGNPEARRLIRQREILLKRERSLFRNQKALEQRYRGDLGIGRLSFRWPNARELLNDLNDGLTRS